MIADFHIHSKYARACSKNLVLPEIARACELKGIDLVATGDFTHPAWMKHIQEELEEVSKGIYQLSGNRSKTKFILVSEISSIYSQGGKTRRVHSLIFSPNIETAIAYNKALEKRGCNLKSDGRPIVGLSAQDLLRIARDVSPEMILIPAHAWTPWFSVFGSKSGFDSLEECFGDLTEYVRAIETGLSSDPLMNWRLSKLDNITLISNSDAHSLEKLGREATIFSIDPSSLFTYKNIIEAIKQQDKKIIKETVEFFPEEGKYHVDGHASCKFFCFPEETKRLRGICPKCNRPLTVGVLYRVEELADIPQEKVIHNNHIPFRSIIPLAELIGFSIDARPTTKKVISIYEKMIREIGTEFYILLDAPIDKISVIIGSDIAQAIQDMRMGAIKLVSGYDGIFGVIDITKK